MKQSEFIEHMCEKFPDMNKVEVERCLKTFFESIIKSLESGERVELRGFGSFSVRHRSSRIGCDPRTGKAIAVSERYVPFFKAGKGLHEEVNTS
tara:strand:+ start:320 stop:601 length:282 start_codon:yes stop_codon:yes gene_type:complete